MHGQKNIKFLTSVAVHSDSTVPRITVEVKVVSCGTP